MIKSKDLCKGCRFDRTFCYFLNTNKKSLCPCINCLVKVMCKEVCCLRNLNKNLGVTLKLTYPLTGKERRVDVQLPE